MTAIFRDNLGDIEFHHVANIQHIKDDIWSIMFTNYESQEFKGELVEIDSGNY